LIESDTHSPNVPLAGAVVHVDQYGKLAVVRALIRAEDRKTQNASGAATASGSASTVTPKPPRAEFSEKLLRQLTAHRTAALRAMLADNPPVALRVLAWQLALQTCLACIYGREDDPIEIRADVAAVRREGSDLAECKAQQALEVHRLRWGDRLPGQAPSLLAWVLKAGDEDVLDLLAVCTASTLNAVQGREAPQPIADAIAAAVDLDMSEFWRPTAESFLGAVPKAKVLEAVSDAVSPEAARKLDGLKKDALVAQAQQHLNGRRWLPSVLRAKG
jgi:ParB family chromosome partitioning protein